MIALVGKQARYFAIALAFGLFGSSNALAQMYCAVYEYGCNYYFEQDIWQSAPDFDGGIKAAAVADGLSGGGFDAVEVSTDGYNPIARVCANIYCGGWYYIGGGGNVLNFVNGVLGAQWQSNQILNRFRRGCC